MNLRNAVQRGAQHPRVSLVPQSAGSEADDAVFLAASYGLVADPWQALVLEHWLGTRKDGKWSAPRCGLAVPRQNGKNGIIEIRELYGMVALAERFLHTAHEVKTARKAFARLLSFFDNERAYPELHGLVKEIRRTNGQEAITLTNGGSVEFVARSKGSGRGFSVDVLVMDEAQELSDDALAALLPTISVSPNPQRIYTGTPPGPTSVGEVFTRVRGDGLLGTDGRLAWDDWGAESGADLDSRDTIAATNPAVGDGDGARLSWETVWDERADMDDDTFGRERAGIWDDDLDVNAAIPAELWASRADGRSSVAGLPSFGLDVSPKMTQAAISVVGSRPDRGLHGELLQRTGQPALDYRAGVDWIVPAFKDLLARRGAVTVAIAAGGQAETLAPALREAGIVVDVIGGRDVAAACGLVHQFITDGSLTHSAQPELAHAVAGARWRDTGEGAQIFGRVKSTVDITPLYALTLAVWLAHTKPPLEDVTVAFI